MKKLRTRRHSVVLNRSAGGDLGITILLVLLGAFMFLPLWYQIVNSLKPLGEINMTPPRFYVIKPTLKNFAKTESAPKKVLSPFHCINQKYFFSFQKKVLSKVSPHLIQP